MADSKTIPQLDAAAAKAYVEAAWSQHIEAALSAYIAVPNQSPQFDDEFFTNGHTEKAIKIMTDWVEAQKVPGLKMEVLSAPNRTPLIFITVDGEPGCNETVLAYGHLDKQPPFVGWLPGLGPHTPVIRDGKLYGRGGADDGYAIFAAVTAIKLLKEQKVPHARIVIMIEACEESGSRDLMYYVELKSKEIGVPSLVVCLDSGCGNYEQMWLTTSLRGMLLGELRVKVLTEGVHSGTASGVVPSSFRIIRELLDRIEDSKTGKILVKEAYVDIPEKYRKYAQQAAETIGDQYLEAFPWAGSTKPMGGDLTELILNASWRPTISYTGIDGIPSCAQAGNVLRPETAIRLSIRLPPTLPVEPLVEVLPKILTKDPPYGAEVSFKIVKANKGWCAPPMEHWLEEAVDNASKTFFGKGARLVGEGGSIPFMGMLGSRYPGTQFVVTGVLGPHSNAHGPNEFLHIGMFKNLTCCVSYILAQHYKHVVVAGKSCTEAAESASLPQ